MSGINRKGQKVVCVAEAGHWMIMCSAIKELPVKDKVYTVASIDACQCGCDSVHIHLNEITSAWCGCANKKIGYPIGAFRPVVEDEAKTDISALVDAANKATVKAPQDA